MSRRTKLIRYMKEFYMFVMFFLFALGILIEVVCLYVTMPFFWLHNAIRKENRRFPMRALTRRLFAAWLCLLGIGGLLREKRTIGCCHPGPCLIVANHPGLFDVLFLIRDIPSLSVLVKRSLVKYLPLGPVFRASDYIIAPEKKGGPMETFYMAVEIFKQGDSFLVFPEGSRSPAGQIRTFKPGVFKIATVAGVPIQPVLIRNVPPFLTHGDKWYLPPKEPSVIQIEYLEPLWIQEGDERRFARELQQRYREKLRNLPTHTSK